MFSLRIVNVDSYQSSPTKGYDICYSEFRGCEIYKVPIIRIFGITPAGQKGCLHVHGVFPYFSIRCKDVFPNIEAKSLRKCMQELALDIDKTLNIASRNCNSHRQHVYKIIITEQIPFYGFHEKAEEFLKIYFYNPFDVSRTAELMTNGVILNKCIQPYEAHIPYILQFFIDYNLFGMNLINVSKFKFRASEDCLVSPISPLRNQSLSCILDESSSALSKIWNVGTLSSSQISSLARQTVCELEADCCSSEIMNRLNESFSSGKNPGLVAIWEEERQRRRSENETSQITPLPSQERTDFIETESENFYKKKLRKILETFHVFKGGQKEKIDRLSKDVVDLSSPNISDLSSTQDEEILSMMLSLVNCQSTQLDDDSILGFNHENDLQSECVDEETQEMSQLFTGELEEMWASQISNSDTETNKTLRNTSYCSASEQSGENMIPQLDGAFDEDIKPDKTKSKQKEENPVQTITEESLIQSCNLFQPIVQLSPTILIKHEIESPSERPESDSYTVFMDDNYSLSTSTTNRNCFPVCVPVSRNAHCSLIMNIYENSNDVNIEHTCSSRNSAKFNSLVDAEDPSNIVFEVITNLIYKVECLTEGKTSCYEDFMEEYKGEGCSSMLLQGLNREEKNTLHQIKTTPSIFNDKYFPVKKEISKEAHLPIKKRVFINNWDDNEVSDCESCIHPVPADFSKIGREIVVVKKLSESDLINHAKLNSLKVVIPPLPLNSHPADLITTVKSDSNNSKPMSLIPPHMKKDFKMRNKKSLKPKDSKCNFKKKMSERKIEYIKDEENLKSIANLRSQSSLILSSKKVKKGVPVIKCERLSASVISDGSESSCSTDLKKENLESITNFKSQSLILSSKKMKMNVVPVIECERLNISAISNDSKLSYSTDLQLISAVSNHNFSATNKEMIANDTYSKISLNAENSKQKIRNENKKVFSCKTNSKISCDVNLEMVTNNPCSEVTSNIRSNKTDSKIISSNAADLKKKSKTENSKKNSNSADSKKNSNNNADFKSISNKAGSKITSNITDSKKSSNKTDSNISSHKTVCKITSKNTDSKKKLKKGGFKNISDKVGSKITSQNSNKANCKIISNKVDSKIISGKTDCKIISNKAESKIVLNNEDSKKVSSNADLKKNSNNTDSKITSKNANSIIISSNSDSKISSKNTDSKITSKNKDPKISSNNADSKKNSSKADSKIISNKTDSKITSNNADSKITLKNAKSNKTSNNADSNISSKIKDSMITSNNADLKKNSSKADSKIISNKTDSKITSNNADPKKISKNTDSKKASKDTNSNKISNDEDSKIISSNSDFKISSKNADSKNTSKNKDFKITSNNSDSKKISKNSDSKKTSNDTNSNKISNDEDSKIISSNSDFKISSKNADSKNTSKNKDFKLTSNNSDSKKISKNTDSKKTSKDTNSNKISNDGDLKIISSNSDLKISSKNTDSKNTSKNKDSKNTSKNKDSKITSNNADPKKMSSKADSEIISNETDSKIISNETDSKITLKNANSKKISNHADSKIISSNADCKISSKNKDSMTISKNVNSNKISNNADSEIISSTADPKISLKNTDSKITSINADSKTTSNNADSKTTSNNADSKTTSNNADSTITSSNTCSKQISNNVDARIISSNTDSKISSKNADSKITSNNADSKIISHNADSKIASNNTCSKQISNNVDSKITPNSADSEITSDNAASKITSNNACSIKTSNHVNAKIISSNADSNITLNNADSSITFKNADSSITFKNADSSITVKNEDSEIPSNNADSEIASNNADSSITVKNEDSEIPSNNANSEIPSNNADSEIPSSNADSEIVSNNTDSEIASNSEDSKNKYTKIPLSETVSKIALNNTDTNIASCSTESKIKCHNPDLEKESSNAVNIPYNMTPENSNKNKIIFQVARNETINSISSESAKLDTDSTKDKKCETMSELRLYRRKKALLAREKYQTNPVYVTNCQDVSVDSHVEGEDCDVASIGSRVRERNCSGLQIEYIGTTSKLKTPDTATKYIPVVQLEPCKDLIDKYCKRETDTDCLILHEVGHNPPTTQTLSSVKEKRFFRSRARQQKNQNLQSKVIINHKLTINGSKSKKNRFASSKKSKRSPALNFTVHKNNEPSLRKRSANFDSPDKQKIIHTTGSKLSSLQNEKNSLDKKLEQVYDFESHLNADHYDLDNAYYSGYSLKNKSSTNVLKKNVSCKLSLKLNRKKVNKNQNNYMPEYGISANSDSLSNERPRRSSSFVNYNENPYERQGENQKFTKRLKKSAKDTELHEKHFSDANSGENSDWSIADTPILQLSPPETLKCTISKKKLNFINKLHENEKLPIPKFKVRKKKRTDSLNVRIKLKKPSSDSFVGDSDFKVQVNPFHYISSKKKKKSKRSKINTHIYTSALDVKEKYKKHKEHRHKYHKKAVLHLASVEKNKSSNSCLQNNEHENMLLKKKAAFCNPSRPSLSSYNSNSTPKDEISDISNISPVTEGYLDDSKQSKSSLKMKLKLKRVMTRRNEERIVVVGKELEGIGIDSDECKNEQTPIENAPISEPMKNIKVNENKACFKKTLGAKYLKKEISDFNFNLKSKFKCPLLIKNTKVEKSSDMDEDKKEIKLERKIPKFKYKPFLSNISKDFFSENMHQIVHAPLPSKTSPQIACDAFVISPKKKSPLKNADSFKKELSQLNEMINVTNNLICSDTSNENVKNQPSEMPRNICKISRKLSAEETSTIADCDHSSSSHSRLRERKSSAGCKIPSRRNSLRCQDFKKYFDSDNEENTLQIVSSNLKYHEKVYYSDTDFHLICKPCTVKLQRISAFELEKYLSKPIVNVHNSEKIISCEPLVASFPSPIVDSKSADSYIDPRKIFENLFTFSSPSRSPSNYNTFETSPLIIENDISCGAFSNESSEHSRKEILCTNFSAQKPLKPSEVFKSVERNDMGVLWNLAYLSPPQMKAEKTSAPTSLTQRNLKENFNRKENSIELDDLQKLASQANQLCSISCNLMESEGENSLSILNGRTAETNCKDNSVESKISFKNILEGNTNENLPSFSQMSTIFEENVMSNKSDSLDAVKEVTDTPNSDPLFEPMESLPDVRILDFQECLVESDSEMNPLLNESEMDSVMSAADMILSNSVDTRSYEQCLQTDLSFDDSSLSVQNKPKCASEEPKNLEVDDVFIKKIIDTNLPKQLDTDLTCNNAIITAADTSSLLIPSYKSNNIPVLAINDPCQEGNVNFNTFEEQDLNANGQLFPVVLAPVTLAENANYIENPAATTKGTTSDHQECVNFLEDNELLQSCSVSSTSDIENKNTQASNALSIPFNGEEDILSMIVKSCDIGEEFDVNMNSLEENDSENISSAQICENIIDNNFVVSGPNFIISSQPEQTPFQANSENAVSSSSENNVSHKNTEIVVIKTEPIDVPDVEQIVYEVQDKRVNLNNTDKSLKLSQELENDVLLDSMIHSFYGDNSLYGFRTSANNENISLCPTSLNSSSLSQDVEKFTTEQSLDSLRSSVIKTKENVETCSYKSDSYFKNLSMVNEYDSFQTKNIISNDKESLKISSNSLFISHPFQHMSSKKYHFTPISKPPTRDLVENSVIKSKSEDNLKSSNAVDEDSLSSNSSLSSQTSTNTNDIPLPNVFKKTPLDKNECLSSQNLHNLSKSTYQDDKSLTSSPTLFQDIAVFHSPFINHLASTPSTSNLKKELPLPAAIVSPINKEAKLIADTSKRKRKLVFEGDFESPVKILKSSREKVYTLFNKYGRSDSLNKTMDSLGNLSYSQIEGPTLENSRGFKVSSDNFGDAQVRHEVQHLTVMSLEIHVNTRNDLRPDPKFDSVTAIFYCIYNDIGVNKEEEIVGMIVVDPASLHQTSGHNTSETLKNYLLLCPGVRNGFMHCVENEKLMFEKLVKVVKEWDPDILIGYEIQMSSWGYLIERAEILNINLRLMLSRLTDKNETKMIPVEQDPTVADQTADLSRLNIIGRIVLCAWRLMRKEVTLNVYSFENVYYHVLHKRTPLYAFYDLTNWFLGSQKEKVIRYYVIRVQGCIHFLEKLDIISRTSELARVFGIQFYEVLSRGSQFRVESMMLRTAAPLSYIPVSPSVRQRSQSRAPECVPLILEPESRFYIDPVVVLDFQSLYPSMIIAYNYCFSTCLGRVEHFGKNVPFEFGCASLSVPVTLLEKLQNDIHVSPSGIAFVKSSIRRGILPSMLEEILNTRIMVKQSMKKNKNNNTLKRLLDARQLGLKLISNVTYGYTNANFSGRMPNVEIADSIVGKGRETLERAIHMIENTSKWRAKVVYGDTDSLFILLPGRTRKQAFDIGQEIADAVTADNPKPVKLKFEKVYLPCVLQTKKRYVGFMYETVDQENPTFDAKGIETVRRDSCPATAKILEKSLKILFRTYDVTLVKNYVQKQFTKILSGQANIIDCIFAKEYRGIPGYRPGACVPALDIAKKRLAKDPRSEPRVGERVPYVVVCGFPGLPVIQLVREPIELLKDISLRINASYYITRVISPPLERVFNLLGADIKAWYTNLARTFKPTLPMTRTTNQHRGTLSQYFVTLSCPSCEKPTFTTVCDECREDLQGTTVALNEKIRHWERTVDHLTQICSSCTKSESSTDSCVSLDCPLLFKFSAAKKDLSQAPYLRKVLAHELF